AQHAAFPLALTPDLLYRMLANFQQDAYGHHVNIPWITVADLLLSGLCDELGSDLYEMNVGIRTVLLSELRANPRFGEQRIMELSSFLLRHIRLELESHDPDIRDLAMYQRWNVLALTSPREAARELALALRSTLERDVRSDQVRMASL